MNWLIGKVRISYAHFILISFFIVSCKHYSTPPTVSIVWKDSKAIALAVPVSVLSDSPTHLLKVQLMDSSFMDILGQIRDEADTIFFEPVVPFTRGLHYKVLDDKASIAEIEIPQSNLPPPQLLSVYPTHDTVPENLLKIYLKFSQSMEEGKSLSHISLLRGNDTLQGTFLDLQPELWNNEGTMLTLWLDPGRIKRDLIPNKEMGSPLKSGEKYKLIIENGWRSKTGKLTLEVTNKLLFVTTRDEKSPVSDHWQLSLPLASTKEPLLIHFNEPLDFSLANETITIINKDGTHLNGSIELQNEEAQLKFLPENPWMKGNYIIKIESRLEDLAGNNLNRVFDRDITKKSTQIERGFYEKTFIIY